MAKRFGFHSSSRGADYIKDFFDFNRFASVETRISQYWRGYSNILVILSDSINFFEITLFFPSSRDQNVAVWMIWMCVPTTERNNSYILVVFFRFYYFFQNVLVFSCCRDQLGIFWVILRCVASGWVSLRYSKMLNVGRIILLF